MFRPASRFRPFRFLSSTILLSLLISTSSATCYFPNGKVNTDYQQCPNSLSCCLKGESCLSNGLCFTGNFGILYRGLCADKSWPIAECPRACYTQIPNGWANLFQCNTSSTLLTCSHDVSAGTACQEGNALGTYDYTTANVTIAQNGISTSDNTTTNTTLCDSTGATPSQTLSDAAANADATATNTCPSTVSYKNSQLVAIGAGLGAGLGIPLLITGGLLIYCGGWKRRRNKETKQQQQKYQEQHRPQMINQTFASDTQRWTGSAWKPSELRGSFAGHNELMGSSEGRSELPGS